MSTVRTRKGEPIVCAVCGKKITTDEGYIHHARLAADVHMSCPKTNVRGEDITRHSVLFAWPR